jgi:hypothetical protein
MAHHRRTALMALGLTFGLLAGSLPASAATTEGRITFKRASSPGVPPQEVWAMDADGANAVELTPSGWDYGGTRPSLSPDGRTVASLVQIGNSQTFTLWLFDVHSGDTKDIATPKTDTSVSGVVWSPDGKRLAYARGSNARVYIISRTGAVLRSFKVCQSIPTGYDQVEVGFTRFAWSADGKLWLACVGTRGIAAASSPAASGTQTLIYRMNADGSGQQVFYKVPRNHGFQGIYLPVSRDGRKLLVTIKHRDTDARRTVIVTKTGVTRRDALESATNWSPNGKKLVGENSGGLWTIKADGTGKKAIPGTQAGDRFAHWGRVEPCAGGAQPGPGGKLLIGDATDNLLEGTDADDVICGGGGNDILLGFGGNDVIYGDAGDDQLVGGAGNDRLIGGSGADLLKGGPGNDRLVGGGAKDRLEGEGGNDTIIARDGVRDQVRGGGGQDQARIDQGKDLVVSIETILP